MASPVLLSSLSTGAPPQFDAPFRLGSDGQPATVPQGSPDEISAAIYNIIICPQGGKLHDPDFGIPSPLFDAYPVGAAAIITAVQKFEPRAEGVQITQTLDVLRDVNLAITAQVTTG